MYTPSLFQEDRIDVMHDLMRSFPFASIVTLSRSGIEANHLPLVLKDNGCLKEDGTDPGALHGHVARENPLWQTASAEVLVIFQGPHHYITPSWYPSKQEHGKVVPTWNYAVVHAYGSLHAHDDPMWLLAHLGELVMQQEDGRDEPWAIEDAPEDYVANMLKGIVGFEVVIDRLEGKWKVSQNRGETDRAGVIRGLKSEGTSHSAESADLIRS
jgi:transcriptional regulator